MPNSNRRPSDPTPTPYTAIISGRITTLHHAHPDAPAGHILIDVAHDGTSHAIRLGRTNWPVRVGDRISAIAGADIVRWTPVRCGDGDMGDDRPEGLFRLVGDGVDGSDADDDSVALRVAKGRGKGRERSGRKGK